MNDRAGSNSIAVRVEGLSKKYRLFNTPYDRLKELLHPFRKTYHHGFWALRDVTFEVPKGQTLGLLGRNGSGKSTLLQVIASVLEPTEGQVDVNGRVSALLELGAGFNPEFTGRENVIFSGVINGFSTAEMRQKLPDIEAFADIGEFIDQPVKTYSSGMFARLAFAAAINIDADILIVDEILAVGDIKFQAKCFQALEELRKKSVTIIFVSHSTELIVRLCNQAFVLNDGKLIFSGDPGEAVNAYDTILFGKGQKTLPLVGKADEEEVSYDQRENKEIINTFLTEHSVSNKCHTRQSYTKHEIIGGTDVVDLVDYLLVAEDVVDVSKITSGTLIDLYLKYYFHQSVEGPILGFGLTTLEGVPVFATNSDIRGDDVSDGEAGEFRIVKCSVPVNLVGGNFLLRAGVSTMEKGQPNFLHLRRGFASLEVVETPHCTGLANLECEFDFIL
jgi:lipopolysaccharide transport system ATP-binding protein